MNQFQIKENAKPYTHLNFKNDPDEFQFAIITDNAGGARPGVFAKAVEMVNLLQPEFVINAGDLIEGYDDDEDQIRAWWQEVDEFLEPLEMPFFFLPGNHDFYSEASGNVWGDRYGDKRGYYHFVYKDVLFLMVNTEDPPKTVDGLQRDDPELYETIVANGALMHELVEKENQTAEDGAKLLELAEPVEAWLGEIEISESQVAYFQEVVEAHPNVRWTFCFTHSPPYYSPTGEKDPGNFAKIEALLAGRSYTVFSAHTHTYNYEERQGIDFITTATTGAMNIVRPGAMDHIIWVTMTAAGPKIVNLLLNGIMDKKGPPKDDDLATFGLYRPKV
jgi:3',5'-cyclic AMP phosphodiesterase CpdA